MTPPPTNGKTFNERYLYALIVGATVLGIFLPAATIVLQFSANDFALWQQYKARHQRLENFFNGHPSLDAQNTLPGLGRLSWHHAPSQLSESHYRYYRRYSALNMFLLILLAVFRARARKVMSRAIDWLHGPTDRYARRVVFFTGLVIVLAYLTRAHVGFWFPGISGWTFEHVQTRLTDEPPRYIDGRPDIDASPDELRSLRAGILGRSARYLPEEGYLTAPAMLLHYQGGITLPANLELAELVFPQYVFASYYGEPADPELFSRLIQSGLSARQGGRQFLMPAAIAYPNHTKFMPIDYGVYPAGERLERVSLWTVSILASPNGHTRIAAARRVSTVDVEQR